MKKTILCIVMMLLLSACGAENSVSENEEKNAVLNSENSTPTEEITDVSPYSADEERVLEIFTGCYKTYLEQGMTAKLNYAELEDIYQANPDNEMMENLYRFCQACGYYRLAGIMEDNSYIVEGNKEAAKIDPNYDGPYAEEIISFAKDLLGESYSGLSEKAVKEEENYKNLSLQDKKDIVNYIIDNANMDSDVLWKEIASKYGISTSHVSLINIDVDVIAATGNDRREENEEAAENLDYDAKLVYTGDTVVIASSKDNLDRFLKYVSEGNDDAIKSMVNNSTLGYVQMGTRVKIIDKKATVANVEILEGLYKGSNAWVIIEAIQER